MRLQYCEQKLENQYRMENVCISYVEQERQKHKQFESGCLCFLYYSSEEFRQEVIKKYKRP